MYRKHWKENPPPLGETLKRSVLGERISGQSPALRALGHFDADGWCVWGANTGGPQHGELRKHFVVDLSDQVILPIGIAAPNLPELDEMCRHDVSLL